MVSEWSAGFEAFVGRFASRFTRVESRRQMVAYLRGLLGEVERKNGWTLAVRHEAAWGEWSLLEEVQLMLEV
jgi:hypothetical protein